MLQPAWELTALQDDPIIEYIDDLGRTRSSRRSEVPREFMPRPEEEVEEEEE